MSLWCEEKYLKLLSPQLEHFRTRHSHTCNFRCPLCGDSEIKRSKTRGYVYPKGDMLMYKCHNCGIALPFVALLKRLSPTLFNEFLLEKLRDNRPVEQAPQARSEPFRRPQSDVLPAGHVFPLLDHQMPSYAFYPAYDYLKSRLVPDAAINRVWATFLARTWLTPLVGPEKAAAVKDGRLYLVFPLQRRDGTWYGGQVRPINEKLYITFRWDDEPLRVFGLDQWNPAQPTLIVEGPIDSLFLPNALAMCGADFLNGVRILEDLHIMTETQPRVFVWDNEPRNLTIRHHVYTAAQLHEPVVIWPDNYPKDINDMVKAGIDVEAVIKERTFQGLRAELEFESWKR